MNGKKVDMSLQRNCTDMSLQQNCTDTQEHDCACLTCKTYRKSWPQAALSSAHADHFVLQAHKTDQVLPPTCIHSFVECGRMQAPHSPANAKVKRPQQTGGSHTHPAVRGSPYCICWKNCQRCWLSGVVRSYCNAVILPEMLR